MSTKNKFPAFKNWKIHKSIHLGILDVLFDVFLSNTPNI